MKRTLLNDTTPNTKKADVMEREPESEQLIDLMQEMKGTWKEAADDLLQPRPEAVAQLLKKVLH
jgi:hypothetical protein